MLQDELHVVGVDVGTTNSKAVLARLEPSREASWQCVASASSPTPSHPDDLVDGLLALVDAVLRDRPPPAALGVTSMAETGVPLDGRGAALTPLLTWDAGVGSAEAGAIAEEHDSTQLFSATGVRVSGKVPLVTWSRLRRTEPEMWRRMRHWAGAADLLCRHLTGRLITDHTLAGRTMAYRLPTRNQPLASRFDEDLLAIAGMTPSQLPEVADPLSVAGHTRSDGSRLPSGLPVVVAGHDHQVGAYASGVREPGDRANSLGTTEVVLSVVADRPDPAAVEDAGMSLVRTVAGDQDALLAGSPAAGSLVARWLDDLADSGEARDALRARAAALPATPTGVLVLPYPDGRQCPAPDTRARLRTVGGSEIEPPERLVKALFEGLSLHTRWMLEEQRRLADPGQPIDSALALFGGPGADDPLWQQVKRRVLPLPIRRVEVVEPAAMGAAVVAAEAAGLVAPGDTTLPRSTSMAAPSTDEYGPTFDRFVAQARTDHTDRQETDAHR